MVRLNNEFTMRADLVFIRELMKTPLLSREEEQILAFAWRDTRDEKSLHRLIKAYARLVVSMAIRFRQYGLPLSDLIQEGNLGLMLAAEKFDPTRDVRFSTYAKWWIRSTIQDYILRNWSIVRTGSTVAQKQLFFNLRRVRASLNTVNIDILSDEDRLQIAEKLRVTLKDVVTMENRLAGHDLSLSLPTSDTAEESWQDLIPDERATPEDSAVNEQNTSALNTWIQNALAKLTPREREIISSRRLIDQPETLEHLGKSLNISKERVRQLEVRALRKMRYYLMHTIHDAKDFLRD